ncbi:MAG: acyl-CoA thioesterase [Rhodothermales bacterium]|nr:acyl-CoA thioesterase [Rhodothermales bacterium]
MTEFTYVHRVRYRECDPMGVVYHAHYVDYFEAARTEMLRATGVTYREIEQSGISMPVVDLQISYQTPALYDDLLHVLVSVPAEPPTVRLRFSYRVVRPADSARIAKGTTTLCFIDQQTGRPRRAPEIALGWHS